ncbi:phosphoribosylformylglycinamidine cyclo-ligase [Agrococcus sp. TF02-05]|uniref:phosphoribosylformylglycinamidine cyclo-ligase n=1 Tax=Agrococcus sp. TF02-05 TaxID=2815211 RepID=UPI001AA1115E|nr:phosphoribosylformylglycinamidine cyclo-ligase [Agrococcus sp. TF02-05]MBO1770507.1 phosphoribosylformylglycinamidine cyclo-ligase [Agrococcus sp. TF02-05]
MTDPYASAGVDTEAGDRAVELMKAAVARTHGAGVLGGVGGFAGLFDLSAAGSYAKPLLATSTDGVGTKLALAQAIDKHDTIGQDLVGMVVDDIVVVGAKPLFMTDYIACGRVVPERIADIVRGIAEACEATGTALVGGETAEHPGVMAPDDYDIAGAAVGIVEADAVLGAERVGAGDVVVGMASSGLHSNGFSLVRHVLAERGLALTDRVDELGGVAAEALLEPTRLYTLPLLGMLEQGLGVRAISHVTGGGIAANLARVLPRGLAVEVDRAAWDVPAVFGALAGLGGFSLEDAEGTWNLGLGMLVVVDAADADRVIAASRDAGIPASTVGRVAEAPADLAAWVQGAKGVDGGAVRLAGAFR